MSDTAIYIKTKTVTKIEAQKVAKELGLNLSTIINGFLKQFIETKTMTFSIDEEIPNKHTLSIMKQAEKDYEKDNTSPAFKTSDDSIAWLEKQGILYTGPRNLNSDLRLS